MTIKEQPKPRKAFVPGMRKKYGQNAITISRFLWLFVFLWFPSRQKEKMLSFSLLAGAFLCLSIEQRFACSRFFRTDVLSSQHMSLMKRSVASCFMSRSRVDSKKRNNTGPFPLTEA